MLIVVQSHQTHIHIPLNTRDENAHDNIDQPHRPAWENFAFNTYNEIYIYIYNQLRETHIGNKWQQRIYNITVTIHKTEEVHNIV